MHNLSLFILILFGNIWILKILEANLGLFILVILESLLVHLFLFRKKLFLLYVLSTLFFVLLLSNQWLTTNPQSLVELDNDEQRIKSQRLLFYNPSSHYMRLLFYKLNLKELLEGDINTATTRLQRNFFETIDLNVYFFGGFPRNRVWANDFEKFPYILIFPFLIGMYLFLKNSKLLTLTILLPSLVLLSLIGHQNRLGPFILFPIFVNSIFCGITYFIHKIKILPKNIRNIFILISLLLVILSTIQTFVYGS